VYGGVGIRTPAAVTDTGEGSAKETEEFPGLRAHRQGVRVERSMDFVGTNR
jgi:hypothetical protein